MICHQFKCLFIHIPKVAGQSIESAFLSELGLSWEQRASLLLKKNSNPLKGPPRLAHLTCKEYLDYQYISKSHYHDYFKFTFVRNPWGRLVSEYNYKRPNISFNEFVLDFLPNCQHDDYTHHNGILRHLMPQVEFVFDADNCLVDRIGKFENLQSDFEAISTIIFDKSVSLPYKNKTQTTNRIKQLFKSSKPRPFQTYYNRDTRRFVERFYEKDIKTFNYHFDDL